MTATTSLEQTRLFDSPTGPTVVELNRPDAVRPGCMVTVLYQSIGDDPMYRNRQPSFQQRLGDSVDWTDYSSTTGILRTSIDGPDDRDWYVLRDQRNCSRPINRPVYDMMVPTTHIVHRHPVEDKPVRVPPIQTAPLDRLQELEANRRVINRYRTGTDRTIRVNGFRGIVTSKGYPATDVPLTIGITTAWTRMEWNEHTFDYTAYYDDTPYTPYEPHGWGEEFLDERTNQVCRLGPDFTLYPESVDPADYNPSNARL